MVAVSGEMLKDVLRKEVRARDGLTCMWKGEKSRKLLTFYDGKKSRNNLNVQW